MGIKLDDHSDHREEMRGVIEEALCLIGVGGDMEAAEVIDPQIKMMQYAKINPISEKIRKDFIKAT